MVAVVLLDTNFLYIPMEFKIDVFEEIPRLLEEATELVLLSGVKDEIVEKNKRTLGKLVSKQGLGALQLVSKMVELGTVKFLKIERRAKEAVDDYVIRAGVQIKNAPADGNAKPATRIVIATNDKGLKAKAVAAGYSVVQLRQKTHLELL
nr:hypothetical protein [Candidatus Sigynarchaeota archaeon]